MKFNFGFGKDPEVVGLDEKIAKTEQHSDTSLSEEQNLKKGEGKMFGNPYGEHDYNVRGHEDDERFRNDSHSSLYEHAFVPIEDVADDSGLGDFENQDLTPGLKAEAGDNYNPEADFKNRARKRLDKTEYNTLFSFFGSIEKNGTRQDYVGNKDEHGVFIPPSRSMPRDITNLIKKVNDNGNKMVESLENVYDDDGNLVDEIQTKVPTDSIKFKAPQDPKKMLKKN